MRTLSLYEADESVGPIAIRFPAATRFGGAPDAAVRVVEGSALREEAPPRLRLFDPATRVERAWTLRLVDADA